MKKFLQKLIENKKQERDSLKSQIKSAETADEVRSLGETLDKVVSELSELEAKLAEVEEEEGADGGDGAGAEGERSAIPANAETRGFSPVAHFTPANPQTRGTEDVLDSMEYRQAFATYVRTGVWNFEQRDATAGMVLTADIGKVIPNTILNELIKELKSYGQLYNRVRKLNVAGGVEIPIEDLIPTVTWITETTTSNNQSAPELKNSVAFGYHIAEARIAQSLLSAVVSLTVLESEIAKLLAEAFVKAFDKMIVSGSGAGQPTGILNDTRVKTANKVQMVKEDAVDWTKWREKLFAKIPLAYRGGGVILMTVDTWESLICTMKDANNRPLYSETFDVATGETVYRFNGKEVILVEADLGLYDYSTATSNQAYMIYFKPDCYAINSNLQIGFKRYFNDDTNKWVNKGLTIVDGKLLDVNGVFIVRA